VIGAPLGTAAISTAAISTTAISTTAISAAAISASGAALVGRGGRVEVAGAWAGARSDVVGVHLHGLVKYPDLSETIRMKTRHRNVSASER
jgi:hypothetical protein